MPISWDVETYSIMPVSSIEYSSKHFIVFMSMTKKITHGGAFFMTKSNTRCHHNKKQPSVVPRITML